MQGIQSMRHDNIFTGAGFKSALYASVAFVIATVISGFAIYHVIESALYYGLKNQIKGEVVLFSRIYKEGGHSALVESVKSLENQYTPEPRLIGLFDERKSKIVGNANLRPDFVGWKHVNQTISLSSHTSSYYALSTNVGKLNIVVGRQLNIISPVLQVLFWVLVIAGITAIGISLSIGYFASRRDTTKLNKIVDTLHSVSTGDSYARIETHNSNDQLDLIATQINNNLDKLSSLIENTKNTTTAIAHDLRTPINRASLMLQEAKIAIGTSSEEAQYIERAEEELKNVSDIFETILRISRISGSNDKSGFAPFSLTALASEMIETYQPVAEEKKIRLTGKIDERDELNLIGDRNMVRQALTNLIENAITYCPDNSNICVLVYENQEQNTCLEVRDNGPGIPEENIDKVIEPFYRVANSRTPPGSGLGLALVNAIAAKHNARLVLNDNNPGLRVIIVFSIYSSSDVEIL
jgi:signal transduction histidine kinase